MRVNPNSLAAHLRHGDTIGPCESNLSEKEINDLIESVPDEQPEPESVP